MVEVDAREIERARSIVRKFYPEMKPHYAGRRVLIAIEAERAAIASERERCARVADDWTMDWTRESAHVPSDIAHAIRSGQ